MGSMGIMIDQEAQDKIVVLEAKVTHLEHILKDCNQVMQATMTFIHETENPHPLFLNRMIRWNSKKEETLESLKEMIVRVRRRLDGWRD